MKDFLILDRGSNKPSPEDMEAWNAPDYTTIRAENLDAASQIPADCPIVASTRVYEIRNG